MASGRDRIDLANKNHEMLVHLLKDVNRFPEWCATVAFYKALQIVDALLYERYKQPNNHNDRLALLKQIPELEPIHKHFRFLWSASTIARYLHDVESGLGYSRFTDFMQPDDVLLRLVGQRLVKAEQIALSIFRTQTLKTQLTQMTQATLLGLSSRTPTPPAT